MTRKITAEQLNRLGACEDQVKRFRELFPNGVVPTADLCIKYANDVNWDWAATRFLSSRHYRVYKRLARRAALVERDFNIYFDRHWAYLGISLAGLVVALLAFLASFIFRMDVACIIFAIVAFISFIATAIITINLDIQTQSATDSFRSLQANAFAEAYLSGTAK